jgi:type I restriction enzyme S subunit
MIPEEWEFRLLGDGIDLLSGRHILAKDYVDQPIGVPYLTGPADFPNGTIIVTKYTQKPEVTCQSGDILLTVKGAGTGKLIRADREYCISRQLMAIRTKKWDQDFVYYFLAHNSSRYEAVAAGLIPGISRDDVLQTPILIPPLPEQRKIAETLGTWDQAIALIERRIEAAQQRKKGLMQRLLTGRVRFPEFVRSSKRRETKYGDLPVDWKYVPIGKVAREVSVKNEQDHDYPVLSCTKHYGLVNSLEYFGRQIYSDDLSTYKIVKRNQFAYATNHIEEGSIGYQDLHDFALISPMYTVFEASGRVDDGFLYKVLKTERYRHIFEVNTNGTVNRRGSLRWKVFATIRIPLPSLEEQRRFAAVLQACDREIELLTQKRDALQRQKKGLMQRLLTGRVRVKV